MKTVSKTLILFCLIFSTVYAQKNVLRQINDARRTATNAETLKPFTIATTKQSLKNSLTPTNSSQQLILNSSILKQIETTKPSFLKLSIPNSETTFFNLELIPIEIFAPNFKVVNSKDQEVPAERGIHYKGIIEGDANSLVSISFINGTVGGIISNQAGNFNLSKMKDSENYILFNDKDLTARLNFPCGVEDGLEKILPEDVATRTINAPNVACGAVQIYVEADFALYQAQGSSTANVTTFVNALFAQIAAFYDNEGIVIQISQLKTWDTTDPYVGATDSATQLTAFTAQVGNTFNGHLAQLLSARLPQAGGRASLNTLCTKGKGVNAGITTTVDPITVYSWNVNVVAHEMGHNFGSEHTHSCSWPGGAIDNCFATEGGCPPGPAPVNGGTMMSYCHVGGPGINFANGFGTLPGNLVRNRTQACLGSAVAPTALTAVEVYGTGALLGWTHSVGGANTVEHRIGNGAWTVNNINGNSILLAGLTQNTAYEWRVKTGCSAYSASGNFTTNTAPTLNYCTVTFQNGCNIGTAITNVIIGGTNYSAASGCSTGAYSLTINPTQNLTIGQNYNFTLDFTGNNAMHAAIWIDLNKNGTFEATEKVFGSTNTATGSMNGNFMIPANTPINNLVRMRILTQFFDTTEDPCSTTYTFGEGEDYLVNITNGCQQTVTLANPADNITTGDITRQASATNGVITATNVVSGAGTKATYRAKAINLNAGFAANNGTIFRAEIGGCN